MNTTTRKQPDTTANPLFPNSDSPEFDQWIREVKQQMIASLRKREGR